MTTTPDPGPDQTDRDLTAALAELARVEHGRTPLGEGARVVASTVRDLLTDETEVSVTLVGAGRPRTAAATGDVALRLDERQYAARTGPCLDAARSGRTVALALQEARGVYPEFVRSALDQHVSHSLSVPAPAPDRAGWRAALNVYVLSGRPFSAATRSGVERFAPYAGTFLANLDQHHAAVLLAEGLQQAMRSRAVIEQAKGVLMAREHCSAEQAFELLVQKSQRDNVKLRDIAQALVERVTRREGTGPTG